MVFLCLTAILREMARSVGPSPDSPKVSPEKVWVAPTQPKSLRRCLRVSDNGTAMQCVVFLGTLWETSVAIVYASIC